MRPRILITSGAHPLAKVLARQLSGGYQIRLTDREPLSSTFEFVRSSLDHEAETAALMSGVAGLVHVAEPLAGDDDRQRLDWLTRGTYHLLNAASKANVPKVVFLSTLELMTSYDPNYTVSEWWRPVPPVRADVLSKHLGEMVCREFARDRRIRAVVLRLGKVVKETETKGRTFDPLWVDEEDVAHAVAQALTVTPPDNGQGIWSWWSVFHIGSDSPMARFSVASAKQVLKYQPKVKW
jgi:uronate dehydrogenase